MGFPFAYQMTYRGSHGQQLKQSHPPSRRAPHQLLRHDPKQTAGEQHAGKMLLSRGKGIHQPVNRLAGAAGVQRAQQKMAGFGGGERQRNTCAIAQLAEQDNVGILTQGGAQTLAAVKRQGGIALAAARKQTALAGVKIAPGAVGDSALG